MELHDELFGITHRTIMDPVHGGVGFFLHEARAIDHPLFQRLRFIVQNDITSLVFPGATHTRFQHSIGAMHVAGRFLKTLLRSYLSDQQNKRRKGVTHVQADSIRYFFFCLRLAALLHDSGHFPFSHQFETADTVRRMLDEPSLFETLWRGESWETYYESMPTHLKHEHYSVRVAHEILKDFLNVPDIDARDVLGMMETTSARMSDRFNQASRQVLGLLLRDPSELKGIKETKAGEVFKAFFQTIISGELDIDKMDYLLRDSFYSGCKYGMYNLDHLLSTLRIGFTKKPHWVGLAVTEKGIGAFEDFVHSRFQLYQQVYSHKTVVGFKWLLNNAMNDVLKQTETKKEVRSAITDMVEFQYFTDMFFWERFRRFAGDHPESAADRLIRRRPLEFLQSGEDFSSFKKNQTVEHLKTTLRQKSSNRNVRPEVVVYESPIKFSRVAHPSFEKVRVLVRTPITKRRSLEEIKEKSKFFDKFHDIEITHFYVRPLLGSESTVTKHRLRRPRNIRSSSRT